MAVNVHDRIGKLGPVQRKKVEARAAQPIEEEMSLVAEFPDRAPVVLSGIAGDDPQPTWPGGDTRAADGQVAAYSAPGSAATHAYCARPRSATGANMTDAMGVSMDAAFIPSGQAATAGQDVPIPAQSAA